MIVWIDSGLVQWAGCYRDSRSELGYPSCSAESRAFTGGGVNNSPDPYVQPMIALMELAVLSMDDEMREVVKVAYMSNDNRHDQALRLSFKLKRNVTRPRLTELINQAHRYIEGYSRGSDINLKKVLT